MSNQSYHIERDELIRNHMNLVGFVIKKHFSGCRLDREELISIGYEALISAADQYDPSRGAKFMTFAIKKIKWAFLDELGKEKKRREKVQFVSLDQSLNKEGESEESYYNLFEDESARHEETTLSQMYVDYLLSNLGKRDRRFISLNLGLDEGHEPLGLRKLSKRYRVNYGKTCARRLSIIEKLSEVANKSC